MFFYILWNFLKGYVVIRVEGLSLEKFINLTVSRGIYLWGIKRQSYTSLTAKISISGFRQLRGISRKVRCRVRIVDKRGLPFIMHRYRKRKMLTAGIFIFLLIIYGLSFFIWSVEVEGTEKVDPQEILFKLESLGVKPGAFKPHIDSMLLENQLIVSFPELSWASLEIRGSRAVLRVKEAVLPPEVIDKDTPCNIVAAKDGIIEKMIVLDGQPAVKPGQTVRKGQLLVSGVIEHPDTIGVRYVHSMGQVLARTWYQETVHMSLKEPYRQRTGRKSEIKYLGWERFKIPYRKEEIDFSNFEMEIRQDGFIYTEIYYEVEEIQWSKNIAKLKAKLEETALAKVRKSMPPGAKIIDKKLKYDMIDNVKASAVISIEALEDIAVQQIIDTL